MSEQTKTIVAFTETPAGWDSVDLLDQARSLLVRWPRGDIFIDQGAGPYRVRNRTIPLEQVRKFVADRIPSDSNIRIVLEHEVGGRLWTLDLGATPSEDAHQLDRDLARQVASAAVDWVERINDQIVEWQNKGAVVLVVEDRPEMRDQLTKLVRAEGLEPAEAATVNEAVQKAREQVPNLILLDLELPREPHGRPIVRGGLDVVRQIDDVLKTHRIPIAIVTKQKLSDVEEDARSLGLHDLFNKDPASLQKVSKWLRDHC